MACALSLLTFCGGATTAEQGDDIPIEALSIPKILVAETPIRTITPTIKDQPMIVRDMKFRETPQWEYSKNYREVPPEDKHPIEWVNPPMLLDFQMDTILRWGKNIDAVMAAYDYPTEYYMLILGTIAQESQGINDAQCLQWRDEVCGIGLMGVTPASWTNTAQNLRNPRINISVGTWIFDKAMIRAVRDFNFKPGREATRAALAAYNCGWDSLLADRCASFGGWTYADKVLNYWIPLLEERLGETK